MTNDELKLHVDEENLYRDPRDAEWVPEADANEILRRQRDEELNVWNGSFRP